MTAPWDARSPQEQRRVEGLVLASWGPAVTTAAPFWARRAASFGLEPASITEREQLQRLPATREHELTADAPGGASAVLRPTEEQVKALAPAEVLGAVARAIRRRGDAGERDAILEQYRPLTLHRAGLDGALVVASTRSDLDRMHRAGARTAAVLGLRDDDVVLGAVPAGPSLASLSATHLAQAASLPALHAYGVTDGLGALASAARALPPTVLVVSLADAEAAAEVLGSVPEAIAELRRVVTVGPPPDPEAREAVVAAFGRVGARVSVRAMWGPSAGRTAWAECAPGSGLHTFPDLELLEVVDPFTGAPTDDDGDLTSTTIGWHGTALVRFRTGAWVDPLTTEPCPDCGRTVPRITGEVLPHAWELAATLDDGRARTVDLRGVAAELGAVPGVVDWRVEVGPPAAGRSGDRVLVEVAGEVAAADRHALPERLAQACGVAPEVVEVPAEDLAAAVDRVGGVFADLR